MNFLFPFAGWALALAAPIIAFYLIRTRLERREVSTLLFWDQLKTQSYNSALWRKLRRWISLLLQLLFLALCVLALARPQPSWQSLRPASTVFVLDPSASMSAREGDQSRWERAVRTVADRVGRMNPSDRCAILVASDPPVVLSGWSSSRRSLLAALERAKPVGGSPSLRPAISLAANLLATESGSKVVLLTDGVWKEPVELPPGTDAIRIGKQQPNIGITHFAARRSLVSPGDIRLSLEVVSHGDKPLEGTIEISRDGKLVDVQKVALAPGVPWRHGWDVRSEAKADLAARLVGFPADALAADDSAGLSVPAIDAARVLLVSAPDVYLEAALNALPLVQWARIDPAGFSRSPDAGALTIFHRSTPPAGFEKANCLIIDPGEAGFWGKPLGPLDHPLVSEVPKDLALMRHTGFAQVRLDSATRWEKPPGAQVFADSFGDPLIFGQWDEHRHWALLAFDLTASDFVLRTAFPILLGNAVESLRAARDFSVAEVPGATETALAPNAPEPKVGEIAPSNSSATWLVLPLWWFLLAAACGLLLGEWWLYTRRVTE